MVNVTEAANKLAAYAPTLSDHMLQMQLFENVVGVLFWWTVFGICAWFVPRNLRHIKDEPYDHDKEVFVLVFLLLACIISGISGMVCGVTVVEVLLWPDVSVMKTVMGK